MDAVSYLSDDASDPATPFRPSRIPPPSPSLVSTSLPKRIRLQLAESLNLPSQPSGVTRSGRKFSRTDLATIAQHLFSLPTLADPLQSMGGVGLEFGLLSNGPTRFDDEGFDPATVPPDERKDVFDPPTNFQGAWNHPCPFQREMWSVRSPKP